MKNHCTAGRLGLCAALGLIWPVALQAQVTITAADMFNQPGQYYKAYSNATNNTTIGVSGMLGTTGGPQLWDFTSGPNEVIYRFDYQATTNAAHSEVFVTAGAKMAEIKTDLAAGVSEAWLFFTQDPVKGRMVYGFYDPSFAEGIGGSQAQEVFTPPINDFPATIRYGSAWSCATTFTNTIRFVVDPSDPDSDLVVDLRLTYSSSASVDAYGTAISPGVMSFGDCLRVNELVTYVIDADFGMGDGFEHLDTQYVRNYYWLRPGRGIVAQVTSQQESAPPANDFSQASSMVRMFETNHKDAGDTGGNTGIQGFKMTLGGSGALLQWITQPALTHYRVDYSTNLTAGWQTLVASTTANYTIDPLAGKPGYPVRLYRVVGFP